MVDKAQFKLAAAQMVSGQDVSKNLVQVEELVSQAAFMAVDLLVLPENFSVYGAGYRQLLTEQNLYSEVMSRLRFLAREHNMWIVGGSIPSIYRHGNEQDLVAAPRLRSCCNVVDAEGEIRGCYDKIHLFDVDVGDSQGCYQESDTFEAGDRPSFVYTPFGKIGLSICYDLRFPELFRQYAKQEVEIITVPSAFTQKTGEAHWRTLLCARAIENQAFVVAANQGGWHDSKRQTYGHSMIVNPWGEVLSEIESGAGIVVADINMQDLARVRAKMPALKHARLNQ